MTIFSYMEETRILEELGNKKEKIPVGKSGLYGTS